MDRQDRAQKLQKQLSAGSISGAYGYVIAERFENSNSLAKNSVFLRQVSLLFNHLCL